MTEADSRAPGGADPFWSGVEVGRSSRHEAAGEAAGIALTTTTSRWLGTRCATCQHTFRLGDQVRLRAGVAVGHLDPALRCQPPDAPESADDEQSAGGAPAAGRDRFVDGLLTAWPPANGVPVFQLGPRDWQVATPRDGPSAPLCPGCGHTFRAGDTVIICPCAGGAGDPRREHCQLTVHRDPARGLCCWDEWAPDGRLTRCPRTFLKVTG